MPGAVRAVALGAAARAEQVLAALERLRVIGLRQRVGRHGDAAIPLALLHLQAGEQQRTGGSRAGESQCTVSITSRGGMLAISRSCSATSSSSLYSDHSVALLIVSSSCMCSKFSATNSDRWR